METSTLPTLNAIDALQKLSPAQWATLPTHDKQFLIQAAQREKKRKEKEWWDKRDEKCGLLVDKRTGRCSFTSGGLLWLTKHTRTENPKAAQQGREYLSPFPKKSYFVEEWKAFLGVEPYEFPDPSKPRLMIPKTREMLTSWLVMAYATWRAQWHRWECLVQTESLEKCKELIGYCGQLWRHQDAPLRARHQLASGKQEEGKFVIEWAAGGRVVAIPSGPNKIRLWHPTLYVLDEAAFMLDAQAHWDSANPVAFQMIAVSSANAGWFGDECAL